MSVVKTCEAVVPTKNGDKVRCARAAIGRKIFCHIHLPKLTPKIEAIKVLLFEHGPSFFTNNDFSSQVEGILRGKRSSRLTRQMDKEFVELAVMLGKRALSDPLRFRDKKAWQEKWSAIIKNTISNWERIRKAQSEESGLIPYTK